MDNTTTVFVTGTVYWAKIVGDRALHSNYDGDGREWSYELEPDDVSFLKEHRLLDRLKDKNATNGRGEYLVLRKPEFDKDGNKNEPIRIYDEDNSPWDDRLLGNGTRVVAKLRIVDWGKGKKKGIYTTALRVEELVPFVSNEFGGYDGAEDQEPAKSAKVKAKSKPAKRAAEELDDLDDDIPF